MPEKSEYWIVTDLDGTLMDDNYDITPAKKTLSLLAELSIPVIPCTSKTAAEVRFFRHQNNLKDPFIVENGAAVYGNNKNDSLEWELILGESYKDLRTILKDLSRKLDYELIPLNDLNKEEIYELTRLKDQEIERALDRHWSVPFLNPPDNIFDSLKLICKSYNVHVFKGNRMSHLLSTKSHKGEAVDKLKDYLCTRNVNIIALGDSQNDLPLLEYADISIVIPGKYGPNKNLQSGIDNGKFMLANAPHALGWSNSIEALIEKIYNT